MGKKVGGWGGVTGHSMLATALPLICTSVMSWTAEQMPTENWLSTASTFMLMIDRSSSFTRPAKRTTPDHLGRHIL